MPVVLVVVAAAQVKPGEASRLRPGLMAGSSLVLRSSSVVANISGAILDPKGWYGGPVGRNLPSLSHRIGVRAAIAIRIGRVVLPEQGGGNG
jgi:hypothetical protein